MVCEPHEPQTDPGMGSPGPDVDGPGGDGGGDPATGRGGGGAECYPDRAGPVC